MTPRTPPCQVEPTTITDFQKPSHIKQNESTLFIFELCLLVFLQLSAVFPSLDCVFSSFLHPPISSPLQTKFNNTRKKTLLNTNIQEKYESPFFIISMQHINEIPYCMYIINVILLGYSKHERKLLNHSYIRF